MREETVAFYSEGVRLAGVLRLPNGDTPPEGYPALVHGPGLLGVANARHYLVWHHAFAEAGYATLVIDYRGWGNSDGPRGWLRPDWQVEDMRSAITYLEYRPDIDSLRIGAYGMGGTGGGNAIMAAGLDPRIRCVCAQTAVADGAAWLHRLRREHEWIALRKRLREDDRSWVLRGQGARIPAGTLALPEREQATPDARPLDGVPDLYIRSTHYMMRYRPIDVVAAISPRALLLTSLEDDPITPEDFIIALYEHAGSPKRLVRQTGFDHHQAYRDNFTRLSAEFVGWFDRFLKPSRSRASDLAVSEVAWITPTDGERP
jgi:dipeptidyl aminopeptidase/acylaminoacyl peptidase